MLPKPRMPPPSLPLPSEAYIASRRKAAGLDATDLPTSVPPVGKVLPADEPEKEVYAALDNFRQASYEGITPGGSRLTKAEGERIVGLVRQLSQAIEDKPNAAPAPPPDLGRAPSAAGFTPPPLAPPQAPPPPAPPAAAPAPPVRGKSSSGSLGSPPTDVPPPTPPRELVPQVSAKSVAVGEARALLEDFEWAKVRSLLLPFADAADVRARCGLAECCLHLAEEALEAKDAPTAKERATESLAHATSAVEIDGASAAARVWFGQALQTKAKAVDGGMGQARVCGQMVLSWDKAVELAPEDPLPYHLLGSFAFHVSALPWAAAVAMRQLAPGLRKFSADDSMRYLEQSEERQPATPKGYSLTNRSMIGRLKLQKGKKAEARVWLEKAIAIEESGNATRLDDAAREAAAEARKALKKC